MTRFHDGIVRRILRSNRSRKSIKFFQFSRFLRIIICTWSFSTRSSISRNQASCIRDLYYFMEKINTLWRCSLQTFGGGRGGDLWTFEPLHLWNRSKHRGQVRCASHRLFLETKWRAPGGSRAEKSETDDYQFLSRQRDGRPGESKRSNFYKNF